MGDEKNIYDESFVAYGSLQSSQFCFVKLGASKRADICAVSGEIHVGILQNNPKSGEDAVVRMLGKSKILLGGSCSAGAAICTDHNGAGLACTLGSGDYTLAMMAESGVAGDKAICLVRGLPMRAK